VKGSSSLYYFLLPVVGCVPLIFQYGVYSFPKAWFLVHYFRFAMMAFGFLAWSLYDGDRWRLLFYLIWCIILLGFDMYAIAAIFPLV